MLWGIALLKCNGYISLSSKAIFTVRRFRWVGGTVEEDCDNLNGIVVAQEGKFARYELEAPDGWCLFNKETVEKITVRTEEQRGLKEIKMRRQNECSYTVTRMDIADFCSMIAYRDVFSVKGGLHILGQVEAVLMGTHQRLGAKSHLYGLDVGVIAMILRNVLSIGIREAVDAGVLRL